MFFAEGTGEGQLSGVLFIGRERFDLSLNFEVVKEFLIYLKRLIYYVIQGSTGKRCSSFTIELTASFMYCTGITEPSTIFATAFPGRRSFPHGKWDHRL